MRISENSSSCRDSQIKAVGMKLGTVTRLEKRLKDKGKSNAVLTKQKEELRTQLNQLRRG